jgi:hypothetical protein
MRIRLLPRISVRIRIQGANQCGSESKRLSNKVMVILIMNISTFPDLVILKDLIVEKQGKFVNLCKIKDP